MFVQVRGHLPEGFLDTTSKRGPIIATEPGFMSVSRSRDASVFYMQGVERGDNVLWQVCVHAPGAWRMGHGARPCARMGMGLGMDVRTCSPSRAWRVCVWQLHTKGQTAEGYHMGADISMLSLFPAEEEVLFPPNSALQVISAETAAWVEGDGKRYLVLDAVPSFV